MVWQTSLVSPYKGKKGNSSNDIGTAGKGLIYNTNPGLYIPGLLFILSYTEDK